MMNQADPRVDALLRVLRIIWGALLMSVGLYVLLAVLVNPQAEAWQSASSPGAGARAGSSLVPLAVFLAMGFAAVAVSFVLKRSFFNKAAAEQRPEAVQTGLIIALVLCEAAALFGLTVLFVTGSRYSHSLFALGAAGILAHFPRRESLLAASYKLKG